MRKVRGYLLIALHLCVFGGAFANSVNLFNNTDYKLKATILAADGTVLEEVVLDSRDASTWADDFYQFGYNPSSSMTPYTVQWYCMKGQPFGVCTDVAAGSIVLAQNCSGLQECPEN
jgi:hypothetical protein